MIGITRTCKNPQLAWQLIETLYLNPAAIKVRKQASGILPPIPEYWAGPVFHQPDAFFNGQKIDEVYIELAGELPAVQITPYTTTAQTYLTLALNKAVSRVRAGGSNGLKAACQQWLEDAQSHVDAMIRFDGQR